VFLAGRTRETLDGVAAEIDADGGTAHVAVVDALDDAAVNDHVGAVVDQGGTVASERGSGITASIVNVTSGVSGN
jgi:NADP-dependent 3-hydroxy acid dehydrogenase YdfG